MNESAGRSVLIVEDERIVAMDLQQTLIGLGYDAFAIASSADEAVARATERRPDIVLMDIRIKGPRDGIETADDLRRRFGVPVVFLTAHADDTTVGRATKAEPYGYLLKPVRSAELRSAIEVTLYRHEMDQRLRERERWFSTTLGSIADAVMTSDVGGRVTFMNHAAEVLTGTSAEDAIGRPASDILRLIDDAGSPSEETPLTAALRDNRPVELREAVLLNISTGARRLINDSAAPVIDEGRTLGAVMVFRDVTEQRTAQKRLEDADRLLSLGAMADGVTHEVNNPLAVVVANASFLVDDLAAHRATLTTTADSAKVDGRLEEMSLALLDLQVSADQIGRIISALYAFTQPADAGDAVVDVAQCLESAIRATSHEFRLRARLIRELGAVPAVSANEDQLVQVFSNLLVNAGHAIEAGNVDGNSVTVRTSTDEDGWAAVEVRDTGHGIPKAILARVFEPFFTTKDIGVGSGLGLSICHGIVKSFGGELRVESAAGTGTRFLLRLPPASRLAEMVTP